jgi:tRNA(Arg) A34 adenosine deaminase TadA
VTLSSDPFSGIEINLPAWISQLDDLDRPRVEVGDQMDLVLDLVEANIADGGGPFGAAIFDQDGRLVAPGVNRVVACSAPIAHAEIVAIGAAGARLGTWDLASHGQLRLVSSAEPCAMCLGAVPWSGVTSVVVGARDADVRAIGFDEGDKPADWARLLESRDIAVKVDVGRNRAIELLRRYATDGGDIYNG